MADETACPYCRMPFDEQTPPKIFCTACGMPHHEDCYQENGGCTVFGCPRAPADDPKLQVSYSDLQMTQAVSAVQNPVATPVSPFPRYVGPLGLSTAPSSSATSSAPGANPAMASAGSVATPATSAYETAGPRAKSRTTFILLGVFLGAVGVHNYYAGYTVRGACQLALSVLAFFSPAIVSWLWFPVICVAWIWAIVEICVVNSDYAGIEFS